MQRFGNPADKLSFIAAAPHSVLTANTTIVQLASDVKESYDHVKRV